MDVTLFDDYLSVWYDMKLLLLWKWETMLQFVIVLLSLGDSRPILPSWIKVVLGTFCRGDLTCASATIMLLRSYLRQQRVRVRLVNGILVRGRVRINLALGLWLGLGLGLVFTIGAKCRRSKWRNLHSSYRYRLLILSVDKAKWLMPWSHIQSGRYIPRNK